MAFAQGLKCLAETYGLRPGHVLLRLDAEFVLDGFFHHMRNWEKRDWRGAKKGGRGRKGKMRRRIKDALLWQEILAIERTLKLLGFTFEGEMVKSHSNDAGNDVVHETASMVRLFVESLLEPGTAEQASAEAPVEHNGGAVTAPARPSPAE